MPSSRDNWRSRPLHASPPRVAPAPRSTGAAARVIGVSAACSCRRVPPAFSAARFTAALDLAPAFSRQRAVVRDQHAGGAAAGLSAFTIARAALRASMGPQERDTVFTDTAVAGTSTGRRQPVRWTTFRLADELDRTRAALRRRRADPSRGILYTEQTRK